MSMSASGNSVNLAQGCPHCHPHQISIFLSLLSLQAAPGLEGSGMWRNRAESSALPGVQANPCPSLLLCSGSLCGQLLLQAGHQAGSWALRHAMGSSQRVRNKTNHSFAKPSPVEAAPS